MSNRIRATMPDPGRGTAVGWLVAALPAVLLLLLVFAFPFFILAENSFHLDEGLTRVSTEFTIANYVTFLSDSFYLQILTRTFGMALVVVLACAVLAYPVAYFVARSCGTVRACATSFAVVTLLISLVIRTLGLFPVLGECGLVNAGLKSLGLIEGPLILLNNIVGV